MKNLTCTICKGNAVLQAISFIHNNHLVSTMVYVCVNHGCIKNRGSTVTTLGNHHE
jgi:hypothetical protein